MRPETPDVDSRADLADCVERCADRLDGRLGARIALLDPDGPDVVVDRNGAETFASASVVKLLVLCALYRDYDGRLAALGEPVPLAGSNRVGGTGVLALFDDPEPSLRDLARAMIAVSDNAATNQLIDRLGRERINDVAADMDLGETRLGRKMMETLDDPAMAGDGGGAGDEDEAGDGDGDGDADDPADGPVNTVSPRDCVALLAAVYREAGFSAAACEEMRVALRGQNDASMFPRYLPFGAVVAHKTGWLPDAALDAGVVERDDGPHLAYAVCCDRLGHGGDGTDAIAELGDATWAWLSG